MQWRRLSYLCLISAFILVPALPAFAATSGTIELFDGVSYDFTSYDLSGATFLDGGDGTTVTNFAGTGMGYFQGATIAQDRLYLVDETDGGGEDVIMLIGPNPSTYVFGTTSTIDYVMDRSVGGSDPEAIEVASDVSDGSGTANDFNLWIVRASNYLASALDKDGYTGAGSQIDWANSVANVPISASANLNKGCAACKGPMGDKMYIGGRTDVGGIERYAYKVLDLTNNVMLSDNLVFLPQLGTPFGPPDGNPDNLLFTFHAMAEDYLHNTYYAVVKSGTTGLEERRMYLLQNLPDPHPTQNTTYNSPNGAPSVRLDTVLSFNTRPDRMGMCTGRLVNAGLGDSYPVIYILNGFDGTNPARLYTLVPKKRPDPAGVRYEHWETYR